MSQQRMMTNKENSAKFRNERRRKLFLEGSLVEWINNVFRNPTDEQKDKNFAPTNPHQTVICTQEKGEGTSKETQEHLQRLDEHYQTYERIQYLMQTDKIVAAKKSKDLSLISSAISYLKYSEWRKILIDITKEKQHPERATEMKRRGTFENNIKGEFFNSLDILKECPPAVERELEDLTTHLAQTPPDHAVVLVQIKKINVLLANHQGMSNRLRSTLTNKYKPWLTEINQRIDVLKAQYEALLYKHIDDFDKKNQTFIFKNKQRFIKNAITNLSSNKNLINDILTLRLHPENDQETHFELISPLTIHDAYEQFRQFLSKSIDNKIDVAIDTLDDISLINFSHAISFEINQNNPQQNDALKNRIINSMIRRERCLQKHGHTDIIVAFLNKQANIFLKNDEHKKNHLQLPKHPFSRNIYFEYEAYFNKNNLPFSAKKILDYNRVNSEHEFRDKFIFEYGNEVQRITYKELLESRFMSVKERIKTHGLEGYLSVAIILPEENAEATQACYLITTQQVKETFQHRRSEWQKNPSILSMAKRYFKDTQEKISYIFSALESYQKTEIKIDNFFQSPSKNTLREMVACLQRTDVQFGIEMENSIFQELKKTDAQLKTLNLFQRMFSHKLFVEILRVYKKDLIELVNTLKGKKTQLVDMLLVNNNQLLKKIIMHGLADHKTLSELWQFIQHNASEKHQQLLNDLYSELPLMFIKSFGTISGKNKNHTSSRAEKLSYYRAALTVIYKDHEAFLLHDGMLLEIENFMKDHKKEKQLRERLTQWFNTTTLNKDIIELNISILLTVLKNEVETPCEDAILNETPEAIVENVQTTTTSEYLYAPKENNPPLDIHRLAQNEGFIYLPKTLMPFVPVSPKWPNFLFKGHNLRYYFFKDKEDFLFDLKFYLTNDFEVTHLHAPQKDPTWQALFYLEQTINQERQEVYNKRFHGFGRSTTNEFLNSWDNLLQQSNTFLLACQIDFLEKLNHTIQTKEYDENIPPLSCIQAINEMLAKVANKLAQSRNTEKEKFNRIKIDLEAWCNTHPQLLRQKKLLAETKNIALCLQQFSEEQSTPINEENLQQTLRFNFSSFMDAVSNNINDFNTFCENICLFINSQPQKIEDLENDDFFNTLTLQFSFLHRCFEPPFDQKKAILDNLTTTINDFVARYRTYLSNTSIKTLTANTKSLDRLEQLLKSTDAFDLIENVSKIGQTEIRRAIAERKAILKKAIDKQNHEIARQQFKEAFPEKSSEQAPSSLPSIDYFEASPEMVLARAQQNYETTKQQFKEVFPDKSSEQTPTSLPAINYLKAPSEIILTSAKQNHESARQSTRQLFNHFKETSQKISANIKYNDRSSLPPLKLKPIRDTYIPYLGITLFGTPQTKKPLLPTRPVVTLLTK